MSFRLAVNQNNYPWVPANTPMYDNFANYAVRTDAAGFAWWGTRSGQHAVVHNAP